MSPISHLPFNITYLHWLAPQYILYSSIYCDRNMLWTDFSKILPKLMKNDKAFLTW